MTRRVLAVLAVVVIAGCLLVMLAGCTPEQQAAFRAELARRQAVAAHPFLACVRAHESDTAGGYGAQNPTSSASGAYQFLDNTWRGVSVRAGLPGYARAVHAPPWVQDAVAMDVLRRGERWHWAGTGC